MQQQKDCPFCGSSSKLVSKKTEQEFRKEKFQIREFYYKCASCTEEFTTTATDEVTVNQVYNQYREKHGILFPEELVNLRNRYALSAQKISQVLGLGINTYANYEKGEIPSLSNSRLISSAHNPEVFLDYVMQAKDAFTDKAFRDLQRRINEIPVEGNNVLLEYNLNKYQRPNQYTGYAVPNINKLTNLLLYLIATGNPTYNDKLKLNKLLFYTDFNHYKNTGKSITGFSYRAVPYGPVPANYDYIFAYMTNQAKLIETEFSKTQSSRIYEWFNAIQPFDLSFFEPEELETIHKIMEEFKDISSWDLVELSHLESAWKELHESSGMVSYQEYGFDLRGI